MINHSIFDTNIASLVCGKAGISSVNQVYPAHPHQSQETGNPVSKLQPRNGSAVFVAHRSVCVLSEPLIGVIDVVNAVEAEFIVVVELLVGLEN